jgi:hypothetical protein
VAIGSAGDVICQIVVEKRSSPFSRLLLKNKDTSSEDRGSQQVAKKMDWSRIARFSLMGGVIITPIIHVWFGVLCSRFPGSGLREWPLSPQLSMGSCEPCTPERFHLFAAAPPYMLVCVDFFSPPWHKVFRCTGLHAENLVSHAHSSCTSMLPCGARQSSHVCPHLGRQHDVHAMSMRVKFVQQGGGH